MARQIPTRTDLAHYLEVVELDGKSYGFELYWNTRDLAWYLTVWDASFATRILAGRKLALGAQHLGRFVDDRLPPGELMVVETSGTGIEAGMKELGERVALLYFTAAELVA